MQDLSPDSLIGLTVDHRYLVLSKVADGGMSNVYLAKDLRLGRNIALKILPPRLAGNKDFVAALTSEAASAASLSHPHVVQIHDHAVTEDHVYLVYEFIDGHTLRTVIDQQGALGPQQALDLFIPVMEGLAAAHSAGIVHRDVKPENVLISREGWVKIGDFGLSHAVNATTHTQASMGTVHYIAPELALRRGSDARSDIYSAGIMLYELLTGQQPFDGTKTEVAAAHVRQGVPAPSLLVPGLPLAMDELVRCMTEKNPEDRPANAGELLPDLRHIRQELRTADPGRSTEPTTIIPPLAPGTGFTEVIPAGNATSVIGAPSFPTSVLPSSSLLYPADAQEYDAGDAGPASTAGTVGPQSPDEAAPLSKRQAVAAAKAEVKARAKAAATPRTNVGPRHPRRRALLWTLLVAVLIAVLATAGWFLGYGPGALADVPDVHNKSVPQAQELLRTAGFESVPTSGVFDEKVAAGFIVATDPSAGESVRKFNAITLLISRGPVLYPVPKLVGTTVEASGKALTAASLVVGSVGEEFDEKVPAGTVLTQDPAPGAEFRAGTKVNLVVSKGPKPIPVPTVTGKAEADAVAAIQAAGLVAVVAPDQQNSVSVPAGAVLSQSPDAGELIAGETVTLTISMGPRMIDVPNLVGKQVDAASKTLKDLGFEVQVENVLGGFFGTVRFQTPDGGQAPEGSTIVLKVI